MILSNGISAPGNHSNQVASGPKPVRERNKLRGYERGVTRFICQKALLHWTPLTAVARGSVRVRERNKLRGYEEEHLRKNAVASLV